MPVALSAPFPEDAPDWEHAFEMFFKSVQFSPQNLVYRQSLRGAQFRLREGKPATISFWTKWKLMRFDSKMVKLDNQHSWDDLDLCAEEAIRLDPWDPIANMFAAKALCSERL